MAKEKVSIIIVNFNGKQDTIECLASLKTVQSNHSTTSIIVVDNGSTDNSVDTIKKQFPDVELIENQTNEGFSEANNSGIRSALESGSDSLLILNNDTIVDRQLIDSLVEEAKETRIPILSPKIYFQAGREFHKERYSKKQRGRVIWYAGGRIDWENMLTSHRGVDEVDHGQFENRSETDFATGCAMFVKREVFKKIGLFDKFLFAYFEDADFSIRAKRSGLKVAYTPSGVLWHKNASSSGGSGSKLHDYLITRNRLILGMRYAPIRTKLALTKECWRLLKIGNKRQRQGVIDFLLMRKPTSKTIAELVS